MHNGSEAPRLSPSPEATVQRRPSLPMQAAMDLRRIFLFELPPARHPRPNHWDDTPWERGRPARMLSLRLPLSFPAMLQPTALPAGTA